MTFLCPSPPQLHYEITRGNKANLVFVNASSGAIRLSPSLNTNVPLHAQMEIAVTGEATGSRVPACSRPAPASDSTALLSTDGINTARAAMDLWVLLATDDMIFNSVTLSIADLSLEDFLVHFLDSFIEAVAGVVPCDREDVLLFGVEVGLSIRPRALVLVLPVQDMSPMSLVCPSGVRRDVLG